MSLRTVPQQWRIWCDVGKSTTCQRRSHQIFMSMEDAENWAEKMGWGRVEAMEVEGAGGAGMAPSGVIHHGCPDCMRAIKDGEGKAG